MSRSDAGKAVLFAAIMSILFVSAIFLSKIISYKSSLLSFVYLVLTAALYGFCLISANKKIRLLKWGLSLPFSYIVLQYFWAYHYSVRALNWVFPDYGKETAGGLFTGTGLFFLLCILCAISGTAAMFIKPNNTAVLAKVQLITTICAGTVTIAAVLLLERQFPPYQNIIDYINS